MISLAHASLYGYEYPDCAHQYGTVYAGEQYEYPYEYRILYEYGNVVEFSFCCFFVRFRIRQCNKVPEQYPCIDRIYRDRDRDRQTDRDRDRDR